MRKLDVRLIQKAVSDLCISVNTDLPKDVETCLKMAEEKEISPFGKYILEQIINNADLARTFVQPMCQDTGIAVVYLNLGQDCHVVGGNLIDAVQAGVRDGYQKGYLRASIVEEPIFERKNTKNNTPAVIHVNIVPGEECEIIVMPKGGGAENMGSLVFLRPTAGKDVVMDTIVEAVKKAGSNPCPPIVVGVGIGGTMEKVAALAKEALLRDIGSRHPDSRYAAMEEELLERINGLGIGPQGLGGMTTALAVHINTFPCHIAMLPVAVNINCHAARHRRIVLKGE